MKTLVTYLLLSVSLFALREPLTLTSEEFLYLKKHKILRVHNEKNWPPYNYREKGEPKGLSIEYMNLLATKLGVEVEYITADTWEKFLEMMKEGHLDVMLNIKRTPDREKFLHFTGLYYTPFNGIYTTDRDSIDSLSELKDKIVAVPRGFYTQEMLDRYYPEVQMLLVKDTLSAMKAVLLGKAEATIGQKAVMDYLSQSHGLTGLKLSAFIEDERLKSGFSLATRKDAKLLRDILQKAMNLVTDEEFLEIKERVNFNGVGERKEKLTEKEIKYLYEKKRLTYCVQPHLMPVEGIKKGEHIGFTSDLVSELQKASPVPVVPVFSKTKEEVYQKISEKKCDFVPIVLFDHHPYDMLRETTPYIEDEFVIITRIDKTFINRIDRLKDKRLLVTSKGYSRLLKKKYPFLNITYRESMKEALKKVKKKRYTV